MDANLLVEVIKVILGIGLGFIIHYLMLTPKIAELTSTIKSLNDTVNRLEAKVENLNELRRELFDLEKRVSDNEAAIKFISQDITKGV